MSWLRNTHPILKIVIALAFIVASLALIPSAQPSFGYLSLFLGLFVLFEGFEFKLITKIIMAIVLGVGLAVTSIKFSIVSPADLVAIKPVGSVIFMNCLTMALVPLVFSSIMTGITALGDLNRLNRIGFRTIAYYIITTMIAIAIGLAIANLMQPGQSISKETKDQLIFQYKDQATQTVQKAETNRHTAFQTLLDIFPKNIMESISLKRPAMLQLIFFAVISGIALLKIDPTKAKPVIDFFQGMTDMTITIISLVMRLAPYGVFSLLVATVAQTESLEIIIALIPFSLCVLLGLALHGVGTNFISLKFFSKRDPIAIFKDFKEVAATAFSTASSGATMPLTLKTARDKMGVKNEIASFVIPLGATINMDGTALFQGVSTIFLASIYGVELSFIDQIVILATAVLASIGTAAVPAVGIVILTMILVTVDIPAEGILFILPVNNLLDMCRTVVNVGGDTACAIYINSKEEEHLNQQKGHVHGTR